ncbi:hypothetical protein SLEP1_g24405 [Rubroshorea leprosula]|uniref:Secreted protein n=1 Tax=Rubroshorea leprosula TaxID=152421 RepID=A0AAV5JRR0_9ROSI|nr:hypothetical protein SLEP1_g24405 [Rubroshorea leprosula]
MLMILLSVCPFMFNSNAESIDVRILDLFLLILTRRLFSCLPGVCSHAHQEFCHAPELKSKGENRCRTLMRGSHKCTRFRTC